jgi:hypothetical protein
VVLKPDVSVGVLTMGGLVEPHEEWTDQATDNVLRALTSQQRARGGHIQVARTLEEAGGDTEALADLVRLHGAVGQAIFMHKYAGQELPAKNDRFDWTLGQTAVDYGARSGFDYALFLRAESSFSSGARQGLQVAGLLSCAVGVCVGVGGGQQLAFASLVDLDSGLVTWFNVLASSIGDIRTPEGADEMVTKLLETIDRPAEP